MPPSLGLPCVFLYMSTETLPAFPAKLRVEFSKLPEFPPPRPSMHHPMGFIAAEELRELAALIARSPIQSEKAR